jgi:hypothetical protein
MNVEHGEIRLLSDIATLFPPDSWAAEVYEENVSLGDERVLLVMGDLLLENLDLDDLLGGDSMGPAPYLILVTGNLTISGPIYNVNTDAATGLIVLGDLAAENMVVGGQQVYVGGTLRVANLFWGDYNHGELRVKSDAEARVMTFTDEYHVSIGGEQRARYLLDEAREEESPVDFLYDGLCRIFKPDCVNEDGSGEDNLSSLIDRDIVVQSLRDGLPVVRIDSEISEALPPKADILLDDNEISVANLQALVYCGLIETGETIWRGSFRGTNFHFRAKAVDEDGDQLDDCIFITVADAYQFYLGIAEEAPRVIPFSRLGKPEPARRLERIYCSIAEGEDGEWLDLTPEADEVSWAAFLKAWRGALDYARKGVAQHREGFPLWKQVCAEVTYERILALTSLPLFTELYNDWWDEDRNGYWNQSLCFGARQAVMFEGEQLTPMLKIAWHTGSGEDAIAAYWFELAMSPAGEPMLDIDHTGNQNAGRYPVPRHAADHMARILRFIKSAEEKISADNARYLAKRARSDDLEATRRACASTDESACKDLEHPFFGKLVYNAELNRWDGVLPAEPAVKVFFSLDHCADGKALVATGEEVCRELPGWRKRVEDFAVEKLWPLKNASWLEKGEDEVTPEQFKSRMTLESVSFYPTGEFEFMHADGDLFWGHWIQVTGTLSEGPTHADIPG